MHLCNVQTKLNCFAGFPEADSTLMAFLGTPLVVGVLVAIFLDTTVPGTYCNIPVPVVYRLGTLYLVAKARDRVMCISVCSES